MFFSEKFLSIILEGGIRILSKPIIKKRTYNSWYYRHDFVTLRKKLKFIYMKENRLTKPVCHLVKRCALTTGAKAQGPQKLWGKWWKILHSGSLLALRLKARKHYIYIMNLKEKTLVEYQIYWNQSRI